MTRTRDATNEQIPIDLGDRTGPDINRWDAGFTDSFGIYSCRFSADGNEIVAGGSGNIFGKSGYLIIWVHGTTPCR
jgi:WD repeat-containing protein 23